MKTMYKRFAEQVGNARRRGVDWELSFDEWKNLWLASGKWHMRGRDIGQYVMARFGDQGPYAIDNVSIILAATNCHDGNHGRVRDVANRRNIADGQKTYWDDLTALEKADRLMKNHRLKPKTCPECKLEFMPPLSRRTFCSHVCANRFKGRVPVTEEHRMKISAAMKGRKFTEAHKAALKAAKRQRGRHD